MNPFLPEVRSKTTRYTNVCVKRGLRMGNLYVVALCVEGYQSSGNATVYTNTITIGGSSPPPPGGDNGGSGGQSTVV